MINNSASSNLESKSKKELESLKLKTANIILNTRLKMPKTPSQEKIIEKMGLSSRQAYANIENGKTTINFNHIIKLCRIFDCDVGYLFGEYNTKHRISADVQEVTGLSETAIEYLRDINKTYEKAKNELKKATQNRKKAQEKYDKAAKDLENAVTRYEAKKDQVDIDKISDDTKLKVLNEILHSNFKAKTDAFIDSKSRVEKAAKERLDNEINNENQVENNYLITGMRLRTLSYILENESEYNLLDLIGKYLFGEPIFRNDIDETMELYQAANNDTTEYDPIRYLQIAPLDYLYKFEPEKNDILPMLDFISKEEMYAGLLVRLNNALTELGKKIREENRANIGQALNIYFKKNYPDVERDLKE